MRTFRNTLATAALTLMVGLTAFVVGRALNDAGEVSADPEEPGGIVADATPSVAGDIAVPQPDWDAVLEAYNTKPRLDQVVAGIAVGPNIEPALSTCSPGEARGAAPSITTGTPLAIVIRYLPPGATAPRPEDQEATVCRGVPVNHTVMFGHRVAAGGYVRVHRVQFGPGDAPALRSEIPAEHWYGTIIAGRPAAVGRPVLDEGFGPGDIVIWDETVNVLTIIHSYNLSLVETLKVAERMFK